MGGRETPVLDSRIRGEIASCLNSHQTMSGCASTNMLRSSESPSTLSGSSASWSLSPCHRPGKRVAKGAPVAVVESIKATSQVHAPLSGQIIETNQEIVDDPTLVNSDPLGDGWFFKLKIVDQSEIDLLMGEGAYKTHCR